MTAAWEWIVAAYERPGVAQACLTLQDEHGQNTSLLLWAAWARNGDPAVLRRAAEAAHAWDEIALSPLRAVRRGLKSPLAAVADDARERLRGEVKSAELHAERILVETLERLGGPPDSSVYQAVVVACHAWGRVAPDDAVAALVEALP